MQQINIPTMQAMVRYIAIGQKQPCMFWGPPGCGKSKGISQVVADLIAEGKKVALVDIRLAQYDSVDLRGLPIIKGTQTSWAQPSTMPFKGNPTFDGYDIIILFLDEITAASPATFAVAYQLVNEGRIGEHELRDNVFIVAAGNRDGDRGVQNRMPSPLANRFTHAEIVVDVDAWTWWAQKAGKPAIGIAFIQWQKELLDTFDPKKNDKAFATPRTWEKALDYYVSSMPMDVKQAGMSGAIGEGPAGMFWGFVDTYKDILPTKKIIANPEGVAIPEEPSMLYATTVSLSGDLTPKNAKPISIFLDRLDPEFGILAWQLALRRNKKEISKVPEFIAFAVRHGALFAEV